MALSLVQSKFNSLGSTVGHAFNNATSKVAGGVSETTHSVVGDGKDTVDFSEDAWDHLGDDFNKQTIEQGALNWITPPPPKYEQLTSQEKGRLNQAKQADQFQSVPEEAIVDKNGKGHEPINIEFTGSQQQLQKALQSQGWRKGYEDGQHPDVFGALTSGHPADLVPFSDQQAKNFEGQSVLPSFVMSKDSTGLNRHHMRVYKLGDKDGEPVWGIASSRDLGATTNLGHRVDKDVDPERDTIMHDLFQAQEGSGGNVDVDVVKGTPSGSAQSMGDGTYDVNHGQYESDLEVYQVKFS